MKQVLIVFNPNAGRKQSTVYKKAVVDFILKNHCQFRTISVCDLNLIDFSNFDTVIVIGGDGTVNRVVKECINTDINIGIIPSGTANLLAEKLNIKNNLKTSLEIIKNSNTEKIDVLKINDLYSILRIGFGYDSNIICKTPQSLKNKLGYFAYLLSGIFFALHLKLKNYKISIDDSCYEFSASCFIVANTANMYKNIVTLSKTSNLCDGIFEVFILKTANPLIFLYEFIKIILNYKQNNNNVLYLQGSKIIIKNTSITCHTDGEKIEIKDDITVEVLKSAVNIFTYNKSIVQKNNSVFEANKLRY